MNYFIQDDDQQSEPLTDEQIRLRIRERGLNAFDLVRRESEGAWKALASLEEFQDEVVAVRPGAQPYDARPRGNPMAIVSLMLVLFSLLLSSIFVPYDSALNAILSCLCIITLILGLVIGHVAVKEAKALQNGFGGRVTARVALTIGYFFIILLVVAISRPISRIQVKGNQVIAINNCKQIIATLKIYNADQRGIYPDHDLPNARTSNEVFRELFKAGVADSEAIFGSPNSSDGKPDGNIGEKPDYNEALKPGENHWAMTKGLTDSDPGNIPLVYESPADATWPPTWNPDFAGTTKPGRTWSGGKVIIGFNDGSVTVMPLESAKGMHVGLRPHPDGTPIFPTLPGRKLEVLNVAK